MTTYMQGMNKEMEIFNPRGSSRIPSHNLEDLFEEARSLSEDGIVEIIETEYESNKGEQGVSMTRRRRLEVNLNSRDDINELIEKMRPLSELQSRCFILHKLCKLSIEEVAKRLGVSTLKVETQLEWAYGKVLK